MNKEELKVIARKYAERSADEKQRSILETFFEKLQNANQHLTIPFDDTRGNRILGKILSHNHKRKFNYSFGRKYAAIAAILIILIAVSSYSGLFSSPQLITKVTRRGEKSSLMLPDSSIVILNSNSSVQYPENFKRTRDIILKGEAFFKVKKDPTKPFIVEVNGSQVTVLGTSFNVNAFEKNLLQVSVNSGKVAVRSRWQPKKEFLLQKDQQLKLYERSPPEFFRNDSRNYSAWTQKTIFLDSSTLAETCRILENWYDVNIDFQEPEIRKLRISGKFRDESLKNVLESIALLKGLKIEEINQNHFVIRRKKTEN